MNINARTNRNTQWVVFSEGRIGQLAAVHSAPDVLIIDGKLCVMGCSLG